MSETLVLKSEVRNDVGTKSSARARDEGKLPAVIYGHKQESVSVLLDEHEFVEALHHGHRVFETDVDGKKEQLLLKDLQYDYLGKNVIHADLVRVDLNETVEVSVGIEFKGTAKGAQEGGIVDEILTEIDVECVVTNIPEVIAVNIKELELGDSLSAGDIKLPEGVKLITDPETTIATCHLVAVEPEPDELEETEEITSPEVITEKKDDEDQAEEESKE